MSKCFIEGMGGGGTKLFAAIGVTYPAGSTLTCTNGTKTLTAKTTSGQWVFAIPSAGIWTVTAILGTETASETVVITTEGQFKSVELMYNYVIASNSVVRIDGVASESAFSRNGNVVTGAGGKNGGYYWPVDASKYSRVYFKGVVSGDGTDDVAIGISTGTTYENVNSYVFKVFAWHGTQNIDASIDLTAITGTINVGMFANAGGGGGDVNFTIGTLIAYK